MSRSTTIFTKRPRPGIAKTRLCPALSPGQAARLAEAMLLDTAERLGACPDLGPALAFAERVDGPWFRERVPWIPAQVPQVGEGLGARLAAHFGAMLERADPAGAVVLGSDQPLVPMQRLREAHQALEAGADLVLGPDRGGGYYLVGLRAPHPALFLDVPMSTAGMCRTTADLARSRGLAVVQLAEDLDVDTAEDLRALEDAIAADPGRARLRAPRTCAALAELLPLAALDDPQR